MKYTSVVKYVIRFINTKRNISVFHQSGEHFGHLFRTLIDDAQLFDSGLDARKHIEELKESNKDNRFIKEGGHFYISKCFCRKLDDHLISTKLTKIDANDFISHL